MDKKNKKKEKKIELDIIRYYIYNNFYKDIYL